MEARRAFNIEASDFILLFKDLLNPNKRSEHIELFSHEMAKLLSSKYFLASASGRDAIVLALKAMGLKKGDAIIIPALTLGELIPILENEGWEIIPVDVEKDTLIIDHLKIEEAITEKVKCIMITHLFGTICNIGEIRKIAREYKLPILQDCAHSVWGTFDGKFVNNYGDISIYSFEPGKPLPGYGGGGIATDNEDYFNFIKPHLTERPYKSLPIIKKVFKTWVEEILTQSIFFKLITKIITHKFIAPHFEKAYRKKSKTKVIGSFTGFQASIGLKRLRQGRAQNQRLLNLRLDFQKSLSSEMITPSYDKYGKSNFYNMTALLDKDLEFFRSSCSKRNLDIGICSEVIDDCSKPSTEVNLSVSSYSFKRIVLLPIHFKTKEENLSKISQNLNMAINE